MPMLASTFSFVQLVIGFGIIIFVHELGHFLVAKAVGIRCTQFAIGFGQSLLTWRRGIGFMVGSTEKSYIRRAVTCLEKEKNPDRDPNEPLTDQIIESYRNDDIYRAADALGLGETEYRLNWMPLGGYVKMLGQEDLDPTALSEDPRAFNRKPVWARAAVISAGVFMNLVFGLVFFIIAFMAGVKFPPAIVGDVSAGSPAALTWAQGHEGERAWRGLKPEDRVLSVNGKEARDFTDVHLETALANKDATLKYVVQRPGVDEPITFMLKPVFVDRLLAVGIAPPPSLAFANGQIIPQAIVDAGLKEGIKVVAVNGKPVTNGFECRLAITQARGKPVDITFRDAEQKDGTHHEATVPIAAYPRLAYGKAGDPPAGDSERRDSHLIGLTPVTQVGLVNDDSPAKAMGLQKGDTLVKLMDVDWPSVTQTLATIPKHSTEPIVIRVLRDGEEIDLPPTQPDKHGKLGFVPLFGDVSVMTVLDDSPASRAGIPSGAAILSVNDQPVTDLADLQRLLQDAVADAPQGTTVTIGYRTLGSDAPTAATVTLDKAQADQVDGAMWEDPLPLEALRLPVKADDPLEAAALGVDKTGQFMLQTYITIARLAQRSIPVSELHGPLGIVHVGTKIADEGWPYLLFFLGIISVNLVVINFLPIPIVDGGLMAFLIIEKLKGSPVSPRVQNAATWVGLAMIATIFLTTLWFDTLRLFGH